ncbi:MAG TPA: radical SAM protein [Myxococcales bacterium LLY-WYZ-16_1]|nr:radical SAM protein [Myxococcales bacterium LLY-WYZ-16_1]
MTAAAEPTTAESKPYHRHTYAVWEITLKCNLACGHCGSRAGDSRVDELDTEEALDLVRQMAEVGITEVTLIGGEAFLRPDWLEIAAEIVRCGMTVGLTTGGYGVSRKTAERMKEIGFRNISISIDGLAPTHDEIRGKVGSHHFAFETMKHLNAVGLAFGCNTQINRWSAIELPQIYRQIRDAGARAWQLQLTVPMGNAADQWKMLLQPHELLDLYPMLAYLTLRGQREGVQIQPGNNIGYYGPYERLIRGRGKDDPFAFWTGCQAGLRVLGIEADGKIKGCPSLPTSAYTGGNIRERKLRDIVAHTSELTFNLTAGTERATDHMWGFCKTCEYASLCRGGCSWTSHVFFGKRGNNPYCHHRALVQASRGKAERFFQLQAADGTPFDHGEFGLEEIELGDAGEGHDPYAFRADRVQWPQEWLDREPKLRELVQHERATAIESLKAIRP